MVASREMARECQVLGCKEMINVTVSPDDVNHEVMIEGKAHPWNADTISVVDIRALGEMPADVPVIEEDLRDGTERTLDEDEVLQPGTIEPGKRPTKRVNFRRG